MHGIIRVKNFEQDSGGTSQVYVDRVVVRYTDANDPPGR